MSFNILLLYFYCLDEMDSSDEGKESAKQARPATRPKTRLRIKTAGKFKFTYI